MDNTPNPYAFPRASVADVVPPVPRSPKIIGMSLMVFNVLAALGIVGGMIQLEMGDTLFLQMMTLQGLTKTYFYVSYAVGTLGLLWMIFISLNLMKYRDVGRRHLGWYLVVSVVMTTISSSYQVWAFPADGGFATLFSVIASAVIGLLFYVFFWYYLNKPVVKASLS